MKVLIVDDEELIPRLFRQRFRKDIEAGRLELHFADSGDSALRVFLDHRGVFDLILSDINMPGMSGMDLLVELRTLDCQAMIYMVSAYDSGEYRRTARERGATGFISKPIDFSVLRKLMGVDAP